MIRTRFENLDLPMLGFGAMRLPMLSDGSAVDEKQAEEMVHYAMAHGVNYFDTAHPYHNGTSEGILGRALRQYPRESYYLADKYPGHQIASSYDPAYTFEEQLQRCGVEYFDFYLLHNVCELSMPAYTDPRWRMVDYFAEQKKLGRIRHLGFSTHAGLECLEEFLSKYGEHMEFCQIQLNYLDWTLQDAEAKYELLKAYNLPIFVMEPVRGGKLASLPEEEMEKLRRHRPNADAVEWCFRFLETLPRVNLVLSGMSNMAQLEDNLETFGEEKPLSEAELSTLFQVAEALKGGVPCTACGYCMEGCPMGLNIPRMLATLNDLTFAKSVNVCMWLQFSPADQQPSACIECGKCVRTCPQGIDIPASLKALSEKMKTVPSWAEISRQREEDQKRMRENK